jgi:ankyrin repeat protein
MNLLDEARARNYEQLFLSWALDSAGHTPAHRAAAQNDVDCLKFFWERGADLSRGNSYGETPIHLAVRFTCMDTFKFLLEQGMDPSVRDVVNETPAHIAGHEDNLGALMLLASRGVDLFVKNNDDCTPCDYATIDGPVHRYLSTFKSRLSVLALLSPKRLCDKSYLRRWLKNKEFFVELLSFLV